MIGPADWYDDEAIAPAVWMNPAIWAKLRGETKAWIEERITACGGIEVLVTSACPPDQAFIVSRRTMMSPRLEGPAEVYRIPDTSEDGGYRAIYPSMDKDFGLGVDFHRAMRLYGFGALGDCRCVKQDPRYRLPGYLRELWSEARSAFRLIPTWSREFVRGEW